SRLEPHAPLRSCRHVRQEFSQTISTGLIMNTPVQDHPTIKAHRRSPALQKTSEPHERSECKPDRAQRERLDAGWLRQVCLDAGADDVGFVEIDRPALAEERLHIQRALPQARSLIGFVL